MKMSRPDMDIANAVRQVAGHSHDPSKKCCTAAKKILKYLHATKDLGLGYGDVDATHVSSKENRW